MSINNKIRCLPVGGIKFTVYGFTPWREIFRFYLPNSDILLTFATANTKPE